MDDKYCQKQKMMSETRDKKKKNKERERESRDEKEGDEIAADLEFYTPATEKIDEIVYLRDALQTFKDKHSESFAELFSDVEPKHMTQFQSIIGNILELRKLESSIHE
jgi:hypothetical protein